MKNCYNFIVFNYKVAELFYDDGKIDAESKNKNFQVIIPLQEMLNWRTEKGKIHEKWGDKRSK